MPPETSTCTLGGNTMSRRLAAILLGAVVALNAMPVLGHAVGYQLRETGNAECDFDKDVKTEITAFGHHHHERTDSEIVIFHTPTNVWNYTWVDWNVFAMEWELSNQFGYSYSHTGSGWAGCL